MACVPNDRDCYPDERPRHDVALLRGFWMGKTEVAVGAFDRFTGATEATMPAAPQPVASYAMNGFGLYDVAGNTWEWCGDWYDARAYGNSRKQDPEGPESGSERVLRGGSLNSRAKGLRVSLRNRMAPVSRSKFAGLRCVLPVPE